MIVRTYVDFAGKAAQNIWAYRFVRELRPTFGRMTSCVAPPSFHVLMQGLTKVDKDVLLEDPTKILTKIPKCIKRVHEIPKCHQLDGIALIDERLDPTLTGKMEQEETVIVIEMLTKIRPNFKNR